MRTLSIAALAVVAATLPVAARAAAPAGLVHQKTIYADSADVPLASPEGVACDDRGAVVVADTGNARLVTFSWKDGIVDGGAQIKLPQLPYPVRVQIDSKGFVLVLDRRTRKIVRLDASGEYAGVVEARGMEPPLTPAAFKLDPADHVHVLDVVARRVVVIAPDGKVARTLPLPDAAVGPVDVAADAAGNVYVLDAVGAALLVAGPADVALRPLGKPLKDVASFPAYVAADHRGKLYVADQHGNGLLRLGIDGGFQGRELATGWSDGAVSYPSQICVTAQGELMVADRANNRVQIFGQRRP